MSAEATEFGAGLRSLEAEYEILRELGRGGMAVVFQARDRLLGREVAIKLIHGRWADDREVLSRFAREARLAAQLEHPHIVRMYTVRQLPEGTLALIMQYVPGWTLKEEIVRTGPLAVERVERVLREIGAALACAHAHGIVHRDVKPDNIFIDERDGSALLADFGVARSFADDVSLTVGGMAMGTPAYMSPEQIDGSPLDGRSDLYSLGLVGWEMLTGEAPWAGETFYNVLYRQKTADLPGLRRLRPEIPARLRLAIEGASRKDPARRWADLTEFLAQLDGRAAPRWREWVSGLADRVHAARAIPFPQPGPAPASPEPAGPTVHFRRDSAAGSDVPAAAARDGPAPGGDEVPSPDRSREGSPDGAGDGREGPPVADAAGGGSLDPHPANPAIPETVNGHYRLRFPLLLRRVLERHERIVIPGQGTPAVALVPPGDAWRLIEDDHRRDNEQHRLLEWQQLQQMMARRTLADAGPGRHPRWMHYPNGRRDYAALLGVAGLDSDTAELLMEVYGALHVVCEDVPAGIRTRSGGRIPLTLAEALLERLQPLVEPERNTGPGG